MKNDLISRSDAVGMMHLCLNACNNFERTCVYAHAIKQLEKIPTVDAATVVHGRWIEAVAYDFAGSLEGYKCNICGRFCTDNAEPYCHCGAKMDGKDDAE